jgi:hypothetical protein
MRNLLRYAVVGALLFIAMEGVAMAKVLSFSQGNVKVLSVSGEVSHTEGKPLVVGGFLAQGANIQTSKNSSLVLLFDNGAVVEIKENTQFSIEGYRVVPFDASNIDYGTLVKEPTYSETTLRVSRGNIICKVPKLESPSLYGIYTPLGVGYVKGTVVNVNVSENLDTFVVTDGVVLVQRGSESFYVQGADSPQGQGAEGVEGVQANVENAVALSTDPNQSVPSGLLGQMTQDAQSFTSSASQLATGNAMAGGPAQGSLTDSSSSVGQSVDSQGSDSVSGPSGVPVMPAPFGGGGGGGGSGGGGIYSN